MLQQQGEKASIVVAVHPGLTGWRRRVRDHLEQREWALAEGALKRVRGKTQPDGEYAHQFVGERFHLRRPVEHHVAVPGECPLGQPLVRPVEQQVRGFHVHRVRVVLGGQVELFPVVHAVICELGTNPLPAPEVPGPVLLDERLGFLGQGEESGNHRSPALNRCWVNVMVDECEETDLVAHADELVGECLPVRPGPAPAVQGHDRDRGERGAAHCGVRPSRGASGQRRRACRSPWPPPA
ncbi:unannotated protein [freshwater metagenome]|uniref:Unannotated protein n=1 Tax=freshwater metagenome TaxID=449393 RepID=A0A6J6RP21_9ZZZZ